MPLKIERGYEAHPASLGQARAAQHLVDFARVHLFDMDHLTGEFLECHGAVLDERRT